MKNGLDEQYIDLLKDILENGVEKNTRNGKVLSVFGRSIRYKFKDGKFPLITTKKMHFKSIVSELLWFLQGRTDLRWLLEQGNTIWVGDAYKKYIMLPKELSEVVSDNEKFNGRNFTQEEFINKIKTDDEFAKKWGELGPIYGKQWRSWAKFNEKVYTKQVREYPEGGGFAQTRNVNWVGGSEVVYIDQIANLINDLKTNPDSRRLMVNAWNVGELDQMVLPPCHYGFQVYTRELTPVERMEYYAKHYMNEGEEISMELLSQLDFDNVYDGFNKEIIKNGDTLTEKILVKWKSIPHRAISLMWNQRSVDTFLGLPFNIASYGLLLEIIAKEVNMVPDELVGNLGDVHLYSNHIEQAKEQIGREITEEEILEHLQQSGMDAANYEYRMEYVSKLPKRTKQPYPLPTLKIENEVKWKEGDCLPSYSITDFTLENYQSHSTIKAPLSN